MGCSPSTQVLPAPGKTMATYPLRPSFQYCDRLLVYCDDVKSIGDNIPSPTRPIKSKAEIFDHTKFIDIDRRATMAPESLLRQPYNKLMTFLLGGLKDNLSKVRIIFRWVTAQPLEDIVILREPDPSFPLHQLWRIQQGKGNYAQLILTICRLAGIPCVIINGYLKGSTYALGQSIEGDSLYGEWNAVLIDGEWRFLNAFWGACAVDQTENNDQNSNGLKIKSNCKKTKSVYSCDENYFLTDPEHLSASHFPFVEQWQLLEKPIPLIQFEEMAFLKDRFFNLKMGLVTHDKCLVRCFNGQVDFRFSIPEDNSANLKFRPIFSQIQSSEVPSVGGNLRKQNHFVFIHKIQPDILSLEVRIPVSGMYRLELVGKDATLGLDYDWVVLYKIKVEKGLGLCEPFPQVSDTGWGPGYEANKLSIQPLSHKTGRVKAPNGEVELRFDILNCKHLKFSHQLSAIDKDDNTLKDHVVHWIDKEQLVLLVRTPVKGEYALALFASSTSGIESVDKQNFCNYLVTSVQVGKQGAFPRDFGEGAGQREGMIGMGVTLISHSSPVIHCHREELQIVFELQKPVELFAALSGVGLRAADSKRLVRQQLKGNFLYFTIRLPALGSYGLKVVGMDPNAEKTFQNIFDYLIEFQKRKPRKKEDKWVSEEPEEKLERKESQLSIISEMHENVHLVEVGAPPIRQTAQTQTTIEESPEDLASPNIFGRDPHLIRAQQKIRKAVAEQNEEQLKAAIEELRQLDLTLVEPEIYKAQLEFDSMRSKREILSACKSGDPDELQKAIGNLKQRQLQSVLRKEMLRAQRLLDRHTNIMKNLHSSRQLDQQTVAEIRSYPSPPSDVKCVMMATLLLMGYFEEESENWTFVTNNLVGGGKDSFLKKMDDLDVNSIPVDIALGSREYLRETTLDKVLAVSSGAAAFFTWTQDVIKTVISKCDVDLSGITPRKKKSQKPNSRPSSRLTEESK